MLLSACGFTTDAVATVGGEKITRGELNAALARLYPERDRARNASMVLGSLIDMRVLELEARAQNIDVTEEEITAATDQQVAAAQQFTSPGVSSVDLFQQALLSQGITSAPTYREAVRKHLLEQKLRNSWYQPQVDFVTTKILFVDRIEQAQEAVKKGRSGTSFDQLLKDYASPLNDPRAVDALGDVPAEWLSRSVFAGAFTGGISQGAYSDPIPNSQQYVVIYLAKADRRAPVADDETFLIDSWVGKLKSEKYHPTIADPALSSALAQ